MWNGLTMKWPLRRWWWTFVRYIKRCVWLLCHRPWWKPGSLFWPTTTHHHVEQYLPHTWYCFVIWTLRRRKQMLPLDPHSTSKNNDRICQKMLCCYWKREVQITWLTDGFPFKSIMRRLSWGSILELNSVWNSADVITIPLSGDGKFVSCASFQIPWFVRGIWHINRYSLNYIEL